MLMKSTDPSTNLCTKKRISISTVLCTRKRKKEEIFVEKILQKCFEKAVVKTNANTENLLRIAYSIAVNNRSFNDYPKLIELCESLGMEFGPSLRDRNTCARMVDCIANKMRNDLLNKVLGSNELFTLIIDESDNISNSCCLILYIHTIIDNKPTAFFLKIVEVKQRDSSSMKTLIINVLTSFGFDHGIRQKKFAQFVTDGASTIVGSKTGVGIKLKEEAIVSRTAYSIQKDRKKFHYSLGDLIIEVNFCVAHFI